jgi:hypothetical protein
MKIEAMQQFLLPRRLSRQEVRVSHCTGAACFPHRLTMQDHEVYRKFVTPSNGREVIIRLLNGQDRAGLISFFSKHPGKTSYLANKM